MTEQDSELRAVVTASLESRGLALTAELLEIPSESVLRISCGQPTRQTTRRLARANLPRLDDAGEARSSP
jgi:hypothetical protein